MKRKPMCGFVCKTIVVAAIFLFVGGLMGCEKGMTITVTKDSNPPSFKLSGSGRLFFFSVSEISDVNAASSKGSAIWEIRPKDEDLISRLPEITYGVAPAGFNQTVPKVGAPPPLAEGKTYQAGGPGLEADGGWIRFTIKDGKTVVLSSDINLFGCSSEDQMVKLIMQGIVFSIVSVSLIAGCITASQNNHGLMDNNVNQRDTTTPSKRISDLVETFSGGGGSEGEEAWRKLRAYPETELISELEQLKAKASPSDKLRPKIALCLLLVGS